MKISALNQARLQQSGRHGPWKRQIIGIESANEAVEVYYMDRKSSRNAIEIRGYVLGKQHKKPRPRLPTSRRVCISSYTLANANTVTEYLVQKSRVKDAKYDWAHYEMGITSSAVHKEPVTMFKKWVENQSCSST
jgi:hypothetical protein